MPAPATPPPTARPCPIRDAVSTGWWQSAAPVSKELELRLNGLVLPPAEELHNKPALIPEAQMAAEPEFLLRLYTARRAC